MLCFVLLFELKPRHALFCSDGLERSLRDARSRGCLQPVKIDVSEDPLTGVDVDGSIPNLSNTNPTTGY